MPQVLVDIRVQHDDGTVLEYKGTAVRFTFSQMRDVQRLYTVGSTAVQMIPGPVTTAFQMEGFVVAKAAEAALPKVEAKISHRFDLEE